MAVPSHQNLKSRVERRRKLNVGKVLYLFACLVILMYTTSIKSYYYNSTLSKQKEHQVSWQQSPVSQVVLRTADTFHQTTPTRLDAVHCPTQITSRNAETSSDPNKGMDASPKRFTVTNPPFWISLHKKYYDKMRWVSIMDKGNYYETGITDQFHEILAELKPGLVLDIGMNIGWFTLYSRAHGHSVASFEPNPIMHTRVCESLKLNNWHEDGSVKIFPYGLGDKEATLNLTTGNNPGGSSFYEDRLAKKYRKPLPVRVVTLDSIALQEGWLKDDAPTIHLMKVDVEGYEPIVFKGGMTLVESGKVDNILMENSVTDLRQFVDFAVTVYQAGYKVKHISTVNGEPYHLEMLSDVQEELSKATLGIDLGEVGDALKFLAKVTCNLLWTKRQI